MAASPGLPGTARRRNGRKEWNERNVSGRREIEDIHARLKDGVRNSKRFYVSLRRLDEAAETSLDETVKISPRDLATNPVNPNRNGNTGIRRR